MKPKTIPLTTLTLLILPITSAFALTLTSGCGPKKQEQAVALSPPPPDPASSVRAALAVQTQSGLTAADLSYLRWLVQFDSSVRRLSDQSTAQMSRSMDQMVKSEYQNQGPAGAQSRTAAMQSNSATVQRITAQWQQVPSQFQAKTAPPNCQGIASAYSRHLSYIAQFMQSPTTYDGKPDAGLAKATGEVNSGFVF